MAVPFVLSSLLLVMAVKGSLPADGFDACDANDGTCAASSDETSAIQTKMRSTQEFSYPLASSGKEASGAAFVNMRLLAVLANDVYLLSDRKELTNDMLSPEAKAAGVTVHASHPQENIFRNPNLKPAWAVFNTGGTAVLAIKGTSPTASLGDLQADISYIVKGERAPTQVIDYLSGEVRKLQPTFSNIVLTGHSLGGYFSEVLSTSFGPGGLPGVTFQAPGPKGLQSSHVGPYRNPNFSVINAEKDEIGNFLFPAFFHSVNTIFVKGIRSGNTITTAGDGHLLTTMIEFLGKPNCRDLTNNRQQIDQRAMSDGAIPPTFYLDCGR